MSAFNKTNNRRINQVTRNASLRFRPFTHKAKTTAGWNIFRSFNCFYWRSRRLCRFCRMTLSLVEPVCKNFLCPARRTGLQLSWLLPEAYLVTDNKKLLDASKYFMVSEAVAMCLRRAKARQKSGPGCFACAGKLFSVLIFLVTFCIKTNGAALLSAYKKQTIREKSNSPRGN